MSLKGYQWLNDKGEVLMSYHFKDLTLNVWKDITQQDLTEFKKFLEEHDCEIFKIEYYNK